MTAPPTLLLLLAGFVVVSVGVPLQDTTLNITEVVWSPEGGSKPKFIGTPSVIRFCSDTHPITTTSGACPLYTSHETFESGPSPQCAAGVKPIPGAPAPVRAQPWVADSGAAGNAAATHYTYVYRSVDEGVSWTPVGASAGMHFGTLFARDTTTLYLVGTMAGGMGVAASTQAGANFSAAATVVQGSFDSGATPVLTANGRLWRCLEAKASSGGWPAQYQAVIMSAAADAPDLMAPGVWTASAALPFNTSWIKAQWSGLPWHAPGYLEGNAVLGPDGDVYNVLRVNSLPYANVAVVLKAAADGSSLSFVDMVPFPGGMSKFTLRRDAVTNTYVTLSNNVAVEWCPSARNNLTLAVSTDLLHWRAVHLVLSDDTGFLPQDSVRYSGFHYVDFHIDGDDLVYAVRTAYRGAVSYHNSNRLTFGKLTAFRQYLPS